VRRISSSIHHGLLHLVATLCSESVLVGVAYVGGLAAVCIGVGWWVEPAAGVICGGVAAVASAIAYVKGTSPARPGDQ
jgi:hypothetical protein